MKKIIFIFVLLLSVNLAAATTIYDLVDSIIETENAAGYQIVLGDLASSADVRTTNELVSSFNNKMHGGTLGYDMESNVFTDSYLVLLGNPCENSRLSDYVPCETWPYQEGEALVKVAGNNLIIAGTNPEDTRMAADAVIDYENNPSFKSKSEVMLGGDLGNFEITDIKVEIKVVCGDDVCSPREENTCPKDCREKLSCDALCKLDGMLEGSCREVTETTVCLENEIQKGLTNCEDMEMCCCLKEIEEPVEEMPDEEIESVIMPVEETTEEIGLFWVFEWIINWFKNLF